MVGQEGGEDTLAASAKCRPRTWSISLPLTSWRALFRELRTSSAAATSRIARDVFYVLVALVTKLKIRLLWMDIVEILIVTGRPILDSNFYSLRSDFCATSSSVLMNALLSTVKVIASFRLMCLKSGRSEGAMNLFWIVR